jgi:hypothetical protein
MCLKRRRSFTQKPAVFWVKARRLFKKDGRLFKFVQLSFFKSPPSFGFLFTAS